MDDTDLAYAAGLIDGEGSIVIAKQKARNYHDGYCYRLLVQIGMCDATAPMWMHSIFSGSCKGYDRPEVTCKRVYRWQLADRRASDLLVMLLPYLKTKRIQAELAIEFQKGKNMGRKTFRYIKPQVLKEAEAILSAKMHQLNTMVTSADDGV